MRLKCQMPFLCWVTQVALLSREFPQCQIFVRFILTPVDEVEPDLGGYLHINEGGPVYEKVISFNNLRSGSNTVSANMANGLFVNTAQDVEMHVPLTYMREALLAELKYKKKGHSRQLLAGWSSFLQHKHIEEGDSLIFTRIHDNIVVGLRRRTLYNVPREMVERATLSYFVKEDFTVDYYPQAGDPFVTLIGGEDEEYEGEDEEDDEE